MNRINSALYLDFDNFFGGLLQLDRQAAYALANEPRRWLDALTAWKLPPSDRRSLLVRQAYLNPAGSVTDWERGNDNGRLYFSTFRQNLTRSGFEVVDCPVLTARQKNAADIRIVIDTLQALRSDTRYDEFILVSSDADFAPLLRLLRANDRRTVIISTGQTSPAYHNIADVVILPDDLIGLITSEQASEIEADTSTGAADSGMVFQESERENVLRLIRDHVDRKAGPSFLSSLGIMLRSTSLSDTIERSRWFGAGTLGALIRSMEGTSNLRTKGYYVWDITKHEEPEDEDDTVLANMPASIAQYCRITDLPRLDKQRWRATFATLARYAATQDFHLTHCTAWTRDRLRKDGCQVGRQAIGFVVRGALFGGVRLDAKPAPSADQIREALISSTMDRAQAQDVDIVKTDMSELRDWLGGDRSDATAGPRGA